MERTEEKSFGCPYLEWFMMFPKVNRSMFFPFVKSAELHRLTKSFSDFASYIAGQQYYAKGSGYHIFAGRDGTIPFITGNFTEEECNKHSDELTAAQLYALDHDWAEFYAKEEKYPFVGFLCCRFYDSNGFATEETIRIKERVKGYEKIKAAKDKERREKRKMRMMTMTDPKTTTA